MSFFFYFVAITLSLVFIVTVIMLFHYRNRFSSMTGMLLPMVIGTIYGLTIGVLFGSFFQGNLFYSTGVSILTGILIGTICGLILGLIPSIEGFVAGLMGGMMGAMLGEMITQNQSSILINIFLTLSVSILFLIKILSTEPEKVDNKPTLKWLFKPLLTFITLSSYLFFGSHLDKYSTSSKTSSPSDIEHSAHTQKRPLYSSKQENMTISIQPSQFIYSPTNLVVKKNQKVSLTLKNMDTIEHDIEIKNLQFESLDMGLHTETQNKFDFHLHAPPSKQESITFTPLVEGTYEFYCTIPGHKEQGMVGTIQVLN